MEQSGVHIWTIFLHSFLQNNPFQVQPQIFYGIEVWALTGSLDNIHIAVFKSFLCGFSCSSKQIGGSKLCSVISLCFSALILPSTFTNLQEPAAEKYPHSMMLPTSHLTVGMLCLWWCAMFAVSTFCRHCRSKCCQFMKKVQNPEFSWGSANIWKLMWADTLHITSIWVYVICWFFFSLICQIKCLKYNYVFGCNVTKYAKQVHKHQTILFLPKPFPAAQKQCSAVLLSPLDVLWEVKQMFAFLIGFGRNAQETALEKDEHQAPDRTGSMGSN